MRPKKPEVSPTADLFRMELVNLLDQRHPLVRSAETIDWERFEMSFGALYVEDVGRPGIAIRLMVGLHYLKHLYDVSDEEVVRRWVENPYWQYFCGETHFQHALPINPSSMTRWRQKVGERGMEELLGETVVVGVNTGAVKASSLKRVVVDTTVQEKAISFPTDSKLYNRARERLARLCQRHGLRLRQNYARVGPKALWKANRYGQARQMRRMRRQVKRLKTYLGRVYRDVDRQLERRPELRAHFAQELALSERLLKQQRHDRHKLYSLHAPEVECIAKGKAHKRYEFGVKAGIAVTNRETFVVGAKAFHGNPYDGHVLPSMLEQVERITQVKPQRCYVDKGFRGHGETQTAVYISGQKRGVNTRSLKRELKRRSAIEPAIGHMKNDGQLDRNYLKGELGDRIHVVLCAAGHNLRLILRRLRFFSLRWFWCLGASSAQLRHLLYAAV